MLAFKKSQTSTNAAQKNLNISKKQGTVDNFNR